MSKNLLSGKHLNDKPARTAEDVIADMAQLVQGSLDAYPPAERKVRLKAFLDASVSASKTADTRSVFGGWQAIHPDRPYLAPHDMRQVRLGSRKPRK